MSQRLVAHFARRLVAGSNDDGRCFGKGQHDKRAESVHLAEAPGLQYIAVTAEWVLLEYALAWLALKVSKR
jgi:hypothetical protein